MISIRSIAVQGIGFSPLLISVQGLLPEADQGSGRLRGGHFIVNMGRMMGR